MEELKYDINEIAFGISVEPHLKRMLLEEKIEDFDIYELAALCMGVYEIFKALLNNNKLLPDEIENTDLFIKNYDFSIRQTLVKMMEQYKEMEKFNDNSVLYC